MSDSPTGQGGGGLDYPITQVSLVVNDVTETLAEYRRAFGWSDWRIYDYVPPFQHDGKLHGSPASYGLRAAEVSVGSLNFALLQPLDGPSLWSNFLAECGEGPISISTMFATEVGARLAEARFAELGVGLAAEARVGARSRYFYLDSVERFGCFIESGYAYADDFDSPTAVASGSPGGESRPKRSNEITQVAVVVHDLDSKLKLYHDAFGWGPWKVFHSDGERIMHSCTMDGEPCEFFNIRWAEVKVGDVIFELVEPVCGDNPWRRMLDTKGEGIGSIAVMFKTEKDSEDVKREFREAGREVTSSGRIGDHIEWYYLDTEPSFKCVIESGSGHAIEFMEPDYVYPPVER